MANPELFNPAGVEVEKIVFMEGTAIDGRKVSSAEISEIVSNTNRLMKVNGFTPVVNVGHTYFFGDEKPLAGFVKSVRKRRVRTGEGNKVNAISAKIHFNEPLATDYQAGKYPFGSAEIAEEGFTNAGAKLGKFLAGFAVLGSSVPAHSQVFSRIRFAPDPDNPGKYKTAKTDLKDGPIRIFEAESKKDKKEGDYMAMNAEELRTMADDLQAKSDMLREWADEIDSGDGEVDETGSNDDPGTEEMAGEGGGEFKSILTKFSTTLDGINKRLDKIEGREPAAKPVDPEIDPAIEAAHNALPKGAIDLDKFKALAAAVGVKEATELYRSKGSRDPVDPKVASGRVESDKDTVILKYAMQYEKMGMPKAAAEKAAVALYDINSKNREAS